MAFQKKESSWDGPERRQPPVVLVVNEDPSACQLLVRFLAHSGLTAVGAAGYSEALAQMVDELPRCVVLDMHSGGVGSSLKILDQIRTHDDRRINTARVVLCAPTAKNRAFSFQSGADAFVVRPFHINDLIEEINDVIDRPQDDRARHRRDELARSD